MEGVEWSADRTQILLIPGRADALHLSNIAMAATFWLSMYGEYD